MSHPSATESARATRRAERRRRRTWTIGAGAVLLLLVGGVVAATMLSGSGDAEVSGAVIRRSSAARKPSAVTTPASTVAALPCRANLTPEDPLRLWIAGDSLAYSVGNGLGSPAAKTGVVAPVYESRVSSGLTTPGFFDWPRRVAQELPRLEPEVVVFVMGTNDWSVPAPTPVDASGQPAWKASYRTKVQDMVDALTADGRTLYWVAPPVLRDPRQEAGIRDVTAVIRSVVDATPDARFFDLHDLLDGDSGAYTATVPVDGTRVQVRTSDGVHLTPGGADYVGAALFARLDAQCRLEAQAVPGRPQRLVQTQGSTSVGAQSGDTTPTSAAVPEPTTAATVAPAPAVTVPSTQAPTATTGTTATTGSGPPGKAATP